MSLEREVVTTLRVRYAETDAQGVAYHANYLVWFEVARGDYLRAVGVDYNQLEAAGSYAVVAEIHARYLAPARYDDVLTVVARISELKTRSFRFSYRVSRGAVALAEGWSTHLMVNRAGRAVHLPAELRRALETPAPASFRGDAFLSPEA